MKITDLEHNIVIYSHIVNVNIFTRIKLRTMVSTCYHNCKSMFNVNI